MPCSREIGRDNTVAALRTERGLVLIVVVLLGLIVTVFILNSLLLHARAIESQQRVQG